MERDNSYIHLLLQDIQAKLMMDAIGTWNEWMY